MFFLNVNAEESEILGAKTFVKKGSFVKKENI